MSWYTMNGDSLTLFPTNNPNSRSWQEIRLEMPCIRSKFIPVNVDAAIAQIESNWGIFLSLQV